MSHVFISYARTDEPFVRRLHQALEAQGRKAWVDLEGIRPSEEWLARIHTAIEAAHAVVFVISPASLASIVCGQELAYAVQHNKRLIPIVYREAAGAVPEELRRLNWIFFRDSDRFETAVTTLGTALDTDLAWVDVHTELLVKAREWEQKNRERSLLLRGRELASAERWLANAASHPDSPPTSLHTTYVLAGRAAATRRQWMAAAMAAVVLLVVSGLTLAAWLEQGRKREQATLRNVAEANRLIYRQPDQALMLAEQARRMAPNDASRMVATAAERLALDVMRGRRDIAKREALQWASSFSLVASTWFRGSLSARLSPDGRQIILTTERGPDGPRPPGDAYLLDYETLKVARLQVPGRDERQARRLEYAGFSSTGQKIYLSRQYDIEIYARDGSFEKVLDNAMGRTKEPIQVVEGLQNDRLILFGDTDGQLCVLEPEANRATNCSRVGSAPVTELKVSPSGRWVVAVRRNGRAYTWDMTDPRGSRPKELPGAGIVTVSFSPRATEDTLIAGYRSGDLETWSLAGPSPERVAHFRHGPVAVGYASFLEDGEHVLTVDDALSARIWNARTGEQAAEVGADLRIDWASLRASRKTKTPLVAFSAAAPAPIALTDAQLVVRDIRSVAGATWLLTWRSEPSNFEYGPAYRVDGRSALPYPGKDIGVRDIIGDGAETWLLTGGPAYRIRGKQIQVFPDRQIVVTSVFRDGEDVWLATTQGAFRVRGDEVVRYTEANVSVNRIVRIEDRLWLATKDGAFRLDDDRAVQVTDVGIDVDRVAKIGPVHWALPKELSEGNGSGPAWLVDGFRALPLPSLDRRVNALREIDGAVWLATDKGAYRVVGQAVTAITGCDGFIRSIERHQGRTWLLTENGIFAGPACVVEGDAARPVPSAANGVQAIKELGGDLWLLGKELMGNNAAYRWRRGDVTTFAIEGANVVQAVEAAGSVWLLTEKGGQKGPAYRIVGDAAVAVPDAATAVTAVRQVAGEAWLFGDAGAWRFTEGRAVGLLEVPAAVHDLAEVDGSVWLASSRGALRLDGDTVRAETPDGVAIRRIVRAGGKTFLLADSFDLPSPAYVIEGSAAQELQYSEFGVREIRDVGGTLWALTGIRGQGHALPLSR